MAAPPVASLQMAHHVNASRRVRERVVDVVQYEVLVHAALPRGDLHRGRVLQPERVGDTARAAAAENPGGALAGGGRLDFEGDLGDVLRAARVARAARHGVAAVLDRHADELVLWDCLDRALGVDLVQEKVARGAADDAADNAVASAYVQCLSQGQGVRGVKTMVKSVGYRQILLLESYGRR